MNKYIAEGLGAGLLTLVVGLSLAGSFAVSTPVLAGLVLGLFVYSIGAISGAHINPAVTIGLWSIRKISSQDAIGYIVAQVIGAAISMYVVKSTLGMPDLLIENSLTVFLAELVGTFFFTFGIAAVVLGNVSKDASGIAIGGSLLLGIAIAALLGSNGVLNPAVAFGIGSLSLVYILGPIVGSVFGMQAYKYISK